GEGGLTLAQVREALLVFAKQKHMAAIEVAGYNPTKDPDGTWAKSLIDLLAEVLGERLEALKSSAPVEAASAAPAGVKEAPSAPAEAEGVIPAVTSGDSWSSDMLETESESPDSGANDAAEEAPEDAAENPVRTSEESEDEGSATSVETSEEADDANS
ncbi:MAG TPA: hypothetical protein VK757_07335, partial [Candidatus Acidoferrum sp.]|nr:hypothetical protein [Candidatus Acidoferrum sp.]